MTDDAFSWPPLTKPNLGAAPKKCRRHEWTVPHLRVGLDLATGESTANSTVECGRCGAVRDDLAARRGKNNRTRGNRQELTVARQLNGHKMGPLGLPWDVEIPGYARYQVKKLATPPGLRRIAAELARIGSGAEMPGFVWVEPGRGGEQLIVFRFKDYAERHGLPPQEED